MSHEDLEQRVQRLEAMMERHERTLLQWFGTDYANEEKRTSRTPRFVPPYEESDLEPQYTNTLEQFLAHRDFQVALDQATHFRQPVCLALLLEGTWATSLTDYYKEQLLPKTTIFLTVPVPDRQSDEEIKELLRMELLNKLGLKREKGERG